MGTPNITELVDLAALKALVSFDSPSPAWYDDLSPICPHWTRIYDDDTFNVVYHGRECDICIFHIYKWQRDGVVWYVHYTCDNSGSDCAVYDPPFLYDDAADAAKAAALDAMRVAEGVDMDDYVDEDDEAAATYHEVCFTVLSPSEFHKTATRIMDLHTTRLVRAVAPLVTELRLNILPRDFGNMDEWFPQACGY